MRIETKIIFTLLALFLYISVVSQTVQTIKKGLILNKVDSTAMPFVNIYSDIYKIGTVTNELGEFILSVPNTILNNEITISCLGFFNKKISFDKMKDTIFLSPSVEILKEVIVSNNTPRFSSVVDSIYARLKNNYSNKRHLLKAFYRESAIRDSMYVRIIEADIGIQEYGIKKTLDRDRIKVYQYRRGNNLQSSWQRKFIKVASRIFSMNQMVWLKNNDFIKNFSKNEKYKVYYKNILNNFIFDYHSTTTINNTPVFVFSFYSKDFKNLNLTENQISKIYVNANDYAVIRFEWVQGLNKYNSFLEMSKNIYNYAKIGDFYYLTNVSRKSNFKKEYINYNMYVYKVNINRKEYSKIKRKVAENAFVDFGYKKYKYDSIFWKNYKILPEIPLKVKMQSLIEIEKKLGKQYQDNSNGI
ncbi:hypothetical protein [Lutibacter sp.]|uniref:hypothetical protein n=1 Tax=Lutibacter sp. TaxID=1925666 RepID=UPI0025C58D87|nr:hypothetical protein [Lutibacter sp.]MCF6168566.1 carboxypeptidase-like regulatory domain-containing protein [Lutibacter sp.]